MEDLSLAAIDIAPYREWIIFGLGALGAMLVNWILMIKVVWEMRGEFKGYRKVQARQTETDKTVESHGERLARIEGHMGIRFPSMH